MATVTVKEINYWQVELDEEEEEEFLALVAEKNSTITADGEIVGGCPSYIGEELHEWKKDDFEHLLGYGTTWEVTLVEDLGGDDDTE